jgi:hypothetical protein
MTDDIEEVEPGVYNVKIASAETGKDGFVYIVCAKDRYYKLVVTDPSSMFFDSVPVQDPELLKRILDSVLEKKK